MPAMVAIGGFLSGGAAVGGAAAALGTAATVGTAGIAASMIGANQSKKAAQGMNNDNIAAQKEADQLAYRRWLETQGVGENGQAINTWLPRYATSKGAFGTPRRFRRVGSVVAPTTSPMPGNGGSYPADHSGYPGGDVPMGSFNPEPMAAY